MYECNEAKLSTEQIAEIRKEMVIRGLTKISCQACTEHILPEQARINDMKWVMCRPCYMHNETEATEEEIEQAIKEDYPDYP